MKDLKLYNRWKFEKQISEEKFKNSTYISVEIYDKRNNKRNKKSDKKFLF